MLVTIKIWDIDVKPETKILKPIYAFNSQKILDELSKPPYSQSIHKFDSLITIFYKLPFWRESILTYYHGYQPDSGVSNEYAAFDYIRPNRKIEENSGYILDDQWYLNGIQDTFKYLQKMTTDLRSDRSESEKFKNLYILLGKSLFIDSDSLRKADSLFYKNKSISAFLQVRENPLEILSKNIQNDTAFISSLIYSQTKIYSCISICNNSSQTMEDIKVTLNDVWFYGNYSLFGWTLAANVVDIKKSPNTLQFTVDRLGAGQSIEVLIKGHKYVRDNDIKLLYSGIAYLDQAYVINLMIGVGILVILFHFLLSLKNLNKLNEFKT